ncbi:hypothetical protein DSCW_54350 [Desulfosarcina widdelii]|uniref:Uncharacterized protein n=1 Tax=Desulfosarcina widdelii TaxID=947919 RepID=A0A5K7ZAD1_9BACT|nr:hypothetical protein [Desulfosarcina widdelii]BBO78018.1 hypothetical protein DSCW_54350 [Desulfosarcina widdelii]
MPNKLLEIKIHEGKTNTNIILIAPHGHSDDDENTGILTREIRKKLDCHAIVNQVYRKPKELDDGTIEKPSKDDKILDLNNKEQAKLHHNYLEKIKNFINEPGKTQVIWIHGIKDENLAKEKEEYAYGDAKCLVGYGQGNGNGHSMDAEKANQLVRLFTENGISTVETNENSGNYRGASANNMNQYFKNPEVGLAGVKSVQLEFAFTGVRDADSIDFSSQAIAYAIAQFLDATLVPEQESVIDNGLVETACSHVKGLIDDNNAMLKVGQYLIGTFYAGNYDWAREGRRFKNRSLIELFERLNNEGYAPAKTWLYNSVKLAVDEKDFDNFRTYGKLGHSHKVYLTYVENAEDKKKLIEATVEKSYTVKQLREEISKLKTKSESNGKGQSLPNIDEVRKLTPEKRAPKIKKVEDRKEKLDGMIERLSNELSIRKRERKECDEWLKALSEPEKSQMTIEEMENRMIKMAKLIEERKKQSAVESGADDTDEGNEETENNMAEAMA